MWESLRHSAIVLSRRMIWFWKKGHKLCDIKRTRIKSGQAQQTGTV